MLLRLQVELFGAPLAIARIAVILRLDALRQLLSCQLNYLTRYILLLVLRVKQALVESVLLLSNGIDSLEVVHFLDRAWASPLEVTAPGRGLLHGVVVLLLTMLCVSM